MNPQLTAENQPDEAATNSQHQISNKSVPTAKKTISRTERKGKHWTKSIFLIEGELRRTSRKKHGRSGPRKTKRSGSKKRDHSPVQESGSKRSKVDAGSEMNTVLPNSSQGPDNNVATEISTMKLTERGETYFKNMIAALATETLDVNTFCMILPHICVDVEAPTDKGIDQGEITLLCVDLLKKAIMILSKKRDDFHVDGDEENCEWKNLGSVIKELTNRRGSTPM